MSKTIKITKGHQKMQQRVEDLLRNENFQADINKIKKERYNNKSKKQLLKLKAEEKTLSKLLQKYRKLDIEIEKTFAKSESKYIRLFGEACEKYGLPEDILNMILSGDLAEQKEKLGEVFDFCAITDGYDEFFNPEFPNLPSVLNFQKKSHLRAYPVSLDIHKFASLNDIQDFILKHGNVIESYLAAYNGGKKVIIRQRDLSREALDFIWANQNLSAKDLSKEVNLKFPGHALTYNQISKIISLEKERRKKKFSGAL